MHEIYATNEMSLQAVRVAVIPVGPTAALCCVSHDVNTQKKMHIKGKHETQRRGKHETLPHEGSSPRCLCFGEATHWSGQEMHIDMSYYTFVAVHTHERSS